MGTKLNKETYKKLINADLDMLSKLPHSLEKDHIICVLKDSVNFYYQPCEGKKLVTLLRWFSEIIINNPTMEARRHDCESGIWININFELKGQKYNIGGSSIDIVKQRLIGFLDKHQLWAE